MPPATTTIGRQTMILVRSLNALIACAAFLFVIAIVAGVI
jgi:hypothetical protein